MYAFMYARRIRVIVYIIIMTTTELIDTSIDERRKPPQLCKFVGLIINRVFPENHRRYAYTTTRVHTTSPVTGGPPPHLPSDAPLARPPPTARRTTTRAGPICHTPSGGRIPTPDVDQSSAADNAQTHTHTHTLPAWISPYTQTPRRRHGVDTYRVRVLSECHSQRGGGGG